MMVERASALAQLADIAELLQAREQTDLAEQLRTVTKVLQVAAGPAQEDPLMTTTQAAQALGVRSPNTIKRWVREGLLAGYRRGGRVLVSRSSVERMAQESALTRQHEYEAGLAAALATFDAGEDVADEDLIGGTHRGRTPWSPGAAVRS